MTKKKKELSELQKLEKEEDGLWKQISDIAYQQESNLYQKELLLISFVRGRMYEIRRKENEEKTS